MPNKRRIIRLVALLLALFIVLGISNRASADASIDAATNNLRIQSNLNALKPLDPLLALAKLRAVQISTKFAHPSDWGPLFDALPPCATLLGENIAWTSYPSSGSDFVKMWWASPEHHANIIGNWNYLASDIYVAPNGYYYAVELFMRGCDSTPAPKPTPSPGVAPQPTNPPATHHVLSTPLLPNTSTDECYAK